MIRVAAHLSHFNCVQKLHVVRAQQASAHIELADNRAQGGLQQFASVHFLNVVLVLLDQRKELILVGKLLCEPLQRGNRLRLVAQFQFAKPKPQLRLRHEAAVRARIIDNLTSQRSLSIKAALRIRPKKEAATITVVGGQVTNHDWPAGPSGRAS